MCRTPADARADRAGRAVWSRTASAAGKTARTDNSRDGSAGNRTRRRADRTRSSIIMCSALGSRIEPSSRSARGQTASSLRRSAAIPAGKQRHLMAERDQFLGQPLNDAFGSAIELRRNGFGQRRDLGDVHRATFSVWCDVPVIPRVPSSRTTRESQQMIFKSARNLFFRRRELSATVSDVVMQRAAQPVALTKLHDPGTVTSALHDRQSSDCRMAPRGARSATAFENAELPAHGRSLSVTPTGRFAFIFRYVRRRPISHAVILGRGAGGRRLLGRHAIRRQISGRYAVERRRQRRASGSRSRCWFA